MLYTKEEKVQVALGTMDRCRTCERPLTKRNRDLYYKCGKKLSSYCKYCVADDMKRIAERPL